jgi:putative NADH-flavin reductase
MPAIVIGADHPLGRAIVDALATRNGELRAFVTDARVGEEFKSRGLKVATGDVSDASHVGGAALNAFTAVLVMAAAGDGREISFAPDPAGVFRAWADGVRDARVARVIWVESAGHRLPDDLRTGTAPETAFVVGTGRPDEDIAQEVAVLDDAARL